MRTRHVRLGKVTVLRFGLTRFALSNLDWREKASAPRSTALTCCGHPTTSSIFNVLTSRSSTGG
jgi:hypothetical protein